MGGRWRSHDAYQSGLLSGSSALEVLPWCGSLPLCACSLCQEDMETAKYVWRLCVARHRFYRLNQCDLWVSPAVGIVGNHLGMAFIYLFCPCVRGPHVEVSGRFGESVLSTMWVLGIELSSLSLATSSVHPLSHFVGPDFQVSISNFFALSRMANFIKWHLFLIPLSSCFYEITFYFSIGTSYSYKMPLRFFSTCFFFWQGFAM